MYKSVEINHTIVNSESESESITSSEVIHTFGRLQVWTPHGKDQIFPSPRVLIGAGFFKLDIILEGKRILPFSPSR